MIGTLPASEGEGGRRSSFSPSRLSDFIDLLFVCFLFFVFSPFDNKLEETNEYLSARLPLVLVKVLADRGHETGVECETEQRRREAPADRYRTRNERMRPRGCEERKEE